MEHIKERERLTGHLEKLRVARGQKCLDGQSVSATNAAIRQTECALDSLEDMARESEKRARAEHLEHRAVERAKTKAELRELSEEIREATKLAHDAARNLVDQLRLITELYEGVRMKLVALGETVPAAMTAFEVVSRFGFRLASVLGTIGPNHRHKFGTLRWSLHNVWPASQAWSESEEKLLGLEQLRRCTARLEKKNV